MDPFRGEVFAGKNSSRSFSIETETNYYFSPRKDTRVLIINTFLNFAINLKMR